MKGVSVFVIIISVALCTPAFSQNALVNGGFEVNPPVSGSFGNHLNYPVGPWVVVGTSNVVKVDGLSGGYSYGGNGPEFDATGTAPEQHYLDIASDGTVYQSFIARCSGPATFGGSFSTRANRGGSLVLSLLNGAGTTGTPVAPTISQTLAGGTSATDPWQTFTGSASLLAGQTYTLVVTMDNPLNFDNGFVNYGADCPAPDPCCPPWNPYMLQEMLFYHGTAGINAPYTLEFHPTPAFNLTQMQNYINYLNSLNPGITQITIQFRLHDGGTGTTAVMGPQLGVSHYITWTANTTTGGQPTPTFFSGSAETMQVNRWYVIHTGIYLENNETFFPASCANNDVAVRVQVDPLLIAQPANATLLVRDASGRVWEKPIRMR